MSSLPSLTPQQQQAVERIGESLALTSGAGCGKTLVLARRFTELILSSAGAGGSTALTAGSPFDRFVALTFTEKAAAEMLSRVRTVLLDALNASGSPDDRQRLAEWITELPAAHISTIHSFCAGLLRRHAISAGIDPAFAVCPDELLVRQMQSQAAEDAVLAAVENRRGGALELLGRAEVEPVVQDVRTLLERRAAWQAEDYADARAILTRWRQRQARLWQEQRERLRNDAALAGELESLANAKCLDPGDKLDAYRRQRLVLIDGMLSHVPPTPEALGPLLDKPGSFGSPKAWGGRPALTAYRRRLAAMVERFRELLPYLAPLTDADEEAASALSALTRLAVDALARYAAAKRRAGVLDFEDLVVLTARLLREDRFVRESLRKRLGQLLIDECQDTDATQLQMLWSLLSDDERPPSEKLFIVGDPKQSIYRFRGAQAEVFARLVSRFGASARLSLNESFRMHAGGAAFVNSVFARLMPEDYEPIIARRKELPLEPAVEILLADCHDAPDARSEECLARQGQLVAWRIERMLGGERRVFDRGRKQWRPVRPGDVAVLFARMTQSLPFEQALRQRDIPYYVVGGSGFFRQQEVFDLLNALSAIDNPYDDVALLGLLRSAVFGLDDNVLLELALATRPPYFDRLASPAVALRVTPAQRGQLAFARGLLEELHGRKDALGPAGLIEQLLRRTGYGAVLLSEFHGQRKYANVLRLLEMARAAQQAGGLTLSDFVRRCGEHVLDESRYEQAAVVGETEDVVRLMTIHKAKGLEFPVVILPDLNAGLQGRPSRLLFRPDWGITCKPPRPPGEEDDEGPVSHRLAVEAEKTDVAAEDIRRLYVAVTRHEDYLLLVGADVRTQDGSFKDSRGYLARLDGVLGIAQALDRQADTIEYAKGFSARVARVSADSPAAPTTQPAMGRRIVSSAADAEQVSAGLTSVAEDVELPLVGPLLPAAGEPAPSAGGLAATVLADFQRCPMLYRWRHELRVPQMWHAPSSVSLGVQDLPGARRTEAQATPAPSAELPDAATAGTIFHRCMELLDFEALQIAGKSPAGALAAGPAERPAWAQALARPLLARALGEMELDGFPEALVEDLSAMLQGLARHELSGRIVSARRRLRELAFQYRAAAMDIAGQIDLLYQDAQGAWHVVDYKSDRVDADHLAEHAESYRLQLMTYLAAARRRLGEGVLDATLYFLRPGMTHRFAPTPDDFAGVDRQLNALGDRLVRCRRTGSFPRCRDRACRFCPYASLCAGTGAAVAASDADEPRSTGARPGAR